ncbi:hypothetical protein D7D52_17000 [Nocardia yunnanensis]|uniref:Uncharacterized protein n=1 Tax=Nocardia yunnanensis TaxID=2382165 RepID=A0A386ZD68_9NOCA|nr:hypothetical protein D7D52_17000 [Nocardia yunnanensis]
MLYYSRSGEMAAAWELHGHSIEVMHIRCDGDLTPAYRIFSDGSRLSLPHRPQGTVYFDEWSRPDLATVAAWLPTWDRLFDAVQRDYFKYLCELGVAPSDEIAALSLDAPAEHAETPLTRCATNYSTPQEAAPLHGRAHY